MGSCQETCSCLQPLEDRSVDDFTDILYIICVWIYGNGVNNLRQIIHTRHFDFTTPKGSLKAMQKRKKLGKEQQ